jgi:hypothetical protein
LHANLQQTQYFDKLQNKPESKEPDYDDDENSDKEGAEEKQEEETGEITTVNQVF